MEIAEQGGSKGAQAEELGRKSLGAGEDQVPSSSAARVAAGGADEARGMEDDRVVGG